MLGILVRFVANRNPLPLFPWITPKNNIVWTRVSVQEKLQFYEQQKRKNLKQEIFIFKRNILRGGRDEWM